MILMDQWQRKWAEKMYHFSRECHHKNSANCSICGINSQAIVQSSCCTEFFITLRNSDFSFSVLTGCLVCECIDYTITYVCTRFTQLPCELTWPNNLSTTTQAMFGVRIQHHASWCHKHKRRWTDMHLPLLPQHLECPS